VSQRAPDHQSGADSGAGRTAECLLLSSRFRRAGPAASPRAPDTVITCGGVHDVCVCACRYVSMHSFVLVMLHACELFRNRYTLTKNPTPSTPNIHHTICPLPHCRRARQGQRAWTAINAPPWHLQHHTSHRNTICIPTLCMPIPHTSMT